MNKKIVLKASAGTGKTYRLSLEYIAALLRGESYKNILVMTFTKKATSEIEERIVEFLSLLNSPSSDRESLKEKENLKDSLLLLYPELDIGDFKIRKAFEDVCKNRDRLKIFTIDGFINRIFKTVIAPFLGLENYTLIDSDEEQENVSRLLEKIFSKKNSFQIFKEFLGSNMEKNLDNYIKILRTLLDQRWKYLLLKEAESFGNLKEKRELTSPNESRTPLNLLEEILQHIEDVAKMKSAAKKTEISSADFLASWSSAYISLSQEKLKEIFIRDNSSAFLDEKKNFWNGNKIKGKDVADTLSELKELQESLREEIRIQIYNRDILKYERDVLNFLDELYKNYDEIKLKEGKLTFSDVSTYTYINYRDPKVNLLKEAKITDYFQEIFDGKISTLFIDEFQDTSVLQWKLLSAIAEAAETVLCVGDEKQSLYSWRGGEKELFERLPEILNGKSLELDTCYRSRKNIVNFTNELFKKISEFYREEDGFFESSWTFSPVKYKKDDEAYVEIISPSLFETEYEEKLGDKNFHLDLIVERLKKDFNGDYRDIAVIARTGKELNEMAARLANEHIPFTLKSKKNIFEHRANISIYLFMKFLAYDDLFSLMEFLRSDLIQLGNREMKFLIANSPSVMDYIKNSVLSHSRETDMDWEIESEKKYSREKFEIFLNKNLNLKQLFENIRDLCILYRKNGENMEAVIPDIFRSFGTLSLYSSGSDIKNYCQFLQICKEFKSISEFVRVSETNPSNPIFSQVNVEEKNAVTLITIHSSKGLEYDTVFFIHDPKKAGNGESSLRFYLDLDETFSQMRDFLIINRNFEKILKAPGKNDIFSRYDFIRKMDYKELQEKINGWYVALTRAKRNMFIVLGNEKDDILRKALSCCPTSLGIFDRTFPYDPSSDSFSEKTSEEGNLILDFSSFEFDGENLEENSELQKEFLRIGFSDRERKKIMGTAVHYFLENIKYLTEDELSAAKVKTISQYGGELGIKNLDKIFSSQEFMSTLQENQEIFSQSWDHIYSEFEIRLGKELRRIDRLLIKNHSENMRGEILIVDYKTGSYDEKQIEDYKKAVIDILTVENLADLYEIKTKFMSIKLPEGVLSNYEN